MGSASRVVLILLALLYIIIPNDIVPDYRPVVGWLDDLNVLGLVVCYLIWRGRAFGSRGLAAGYGRVEVRGGAKNAALYALLGVQPGAGPEELTAAFRQAAEKYDPARSDGLDPELRERGRERFMAIQEAYERLMNKTSA